MVLLRLIRSVSVISWIPSSSGATETNRKSASQLGGRKPDVHGGHTILVLLLIGPFFATALIVRIPSQNFLLDLGILFLIVEEFGVGLEDVYITSIVTRSAADTRFL